MVALNRGRTYLLISYREKTPEVVLSGVNPSVTGGINSSLTGDLGSVGEPQYEDMDKYHYIRRGQEEFESYEKMTSVKIMPTNAVPLQTVPTKKVPDYDYAAI